MSFEYTGTHGGPCPFTMGRDDQNDGLARCGVNRTTVRPRRLSGTARKRLLIVTRGFSCARFLASTEPVGTRRPS